VKGFLAVAGNIGSGKSTLTTRLCRRLGWQPYYEVVDENPYLADFYRDMARWSFPLQVFFLTRRFRHHQEILRAPHPVIQDRTIYEDAEVFARTLYLQGLMDERDYRAYVELFAVMMDFLRPPDLVIYLRAPVSLLVERIGGRDRTYERAISADYLARLNDRYEEWIARFDLCPVLVLDAAAVRLDRLDDVIAALRARLPTNLPLEEQRP
jgi:deoxyadenosine/deoxycytidine kinase